MAQKKKPETEAIGGWKGHFKAYGTRYLVGAAFLTAAGALYLNADSRPDGHFPPAGTGNTEYSYIVKLLREGNVTDVRFGTNGMGADGKLRETMTVYTKGNVGTLSLPKPDDPNLYNKLDEAGVTYGSDDVPAMQEPGFFSQYGSTLMVVAAIVGTSMYLARRMAPAGGGGPNGAKEFTKSKAKLVDPKENPTKFDDVAGADDAKEDLQETIEFLRDPTKFERLGARIPKGILLDGPPGTGKTLLAKAVAGEAQVPFYSVSGSAFVEMFVGAGAARVRDMFEEAKKQAPCIIFIDEIDALGRARSNGPSNNDEREQTLNELLTQMDGFATSRAPIIIMGATNRPDILDSALLRPGRFDRKVNVGLPDIKGREMILGVHMKKLPLAEDVEPHVLARGTPGFSGADLANMVNEAALLAAKKGSNSVSMADFEKAKDQVIMGGKEKEDKIAYMDEKELASTAWHEAAHALVAYHKGEHMDPVHKISIIPHGRALGVTAYLPEKDKHSQTKAQIKAFIATALAGRIGEILYYKGENPHDDENASTGASNDIERATQLAEAMVKDVGLSKLGWVKYGTDPRTGYPKDVSEKTKRAIDEEVKKIIDEGMDVAWKILTDHKEELERIVGGLLVHETISGDDMKMLIEGGSIDRTPRKEVRAAAAEAKKQAAAEEAARRAAEEAARRAAEEAAAQAGNDNGQSSVVHQKVKNTFRPM